MNALTEVGAPAESDEYNVVNGLTQAVGELCKPSELQTRLKKEDSDTDVENRGRIILLSHAKR